MKSSSSVVLVVGTVVCAVAVISLRFAATPSSMAHIAEGTAVTATVDGATKIRRIAAAHEPANSTRLVATSHISRSTSTVLECEAHLLPLGEQARMDRMAENLLKHADVD